MSSIPRSVRAVTCVVALMCVVGCDRAIAPAPSPPPPKPSTVVPDSTIVVAVGDIVCGSATPPAFACQHAATAQLTSTLAPDAVIALGDLQYEDASLADFTTFYQPTWGVHKSITLPVAGNHEYDTPKAAGYFDYFNGVQVDSGPAGHRQRGYYTARLRNWRVIVLNSNCRAIGGCQAGSAQEQWLRVTLEALPSGCVMAVMHHPRFSSATNGSDTTVTALWQALYDHGVELVLAGHVHAYERLAPQTASGVADPRGPRLFIVGTGGKEAHGLGRVGPNSDQQIGGTFGVLRLVLRESSYAWTFVPVPGGTGTDSGTASCS